MTTITTTRIAALVALLFATGACESQRSDRSTPQTPRAPDAALPVTKPPPPEPSNPGVPVSPIKLTWSLTRSPDGKSLTLTYAIENPGDTPILVVDDHSKTSTAGLVVDPDHVAILPGADAKTARLIVGRVPLPLGIAAAVEPVAPARELAAKATHRGTKTIPLPLKGWISYESRSVDLSGASRATFEVTWLRPPPPDRTDWAWEVQKDASGKTIRTPFIGYVNTMGGQAVGAEVAIP